MEKEPDGPYVYQPYGTAAHPERAKSGRLYGVGGVSEGWLETEIKGLTRPEAEAVVKVLRGLRSDDPHIRAHLAFLER